MSWKTTCLLPVMLLTICNNNYAQGPATPRLPGIRSTHPDPQKEIQIGDAIPDIRIGNVLNYSTNELRMSDLKGKVVIFDFWATWCTSCVEAFSHIDSLQKEFGADLQIFLVNYKKNTRDDMAKIENLVQKWESTHAVKLGVPIIPLDSSLGYMFKHIAVPHYVWIDKEGKLLATTASSYVTAANIRRALNGDSLDAKIKTDNTQFDVSTPLLIKNNGGNEDHFLYRSLITGYLDGVNAWSGRTNVGNSKKTNHIYSVNKSIVALYQMTEDPVKEDYSYNNRLILEVGDKTKYESPKRDIDISAWAYEHSYSVDLIVPEMQADHIREILRKELNTFFNCSYTVEKREVDCLLLVTLKDKKKYLPLRTKGGEPKEEILESIKLQNQSMKQFAYLLSYIPNLPPLVNETGIDYNIDIDIKDPEWDLKKLMLELNKYGLGLVKSKRLLTMRILKENK